jgi:hypothetical protein
MHCEIDGTGEQCLVEFPDEQPLSACVPQWPIVHDITGRANSDEFALNAGRDRAELSAYLLGLSHR